MRPGRESHPRRLRRGAHLRPKSFHPTARSLCHPPRDNQPATRGIALIFRASRQYGNLALVAASAAKYLVGANHELESFGGRIGRLYRARGLRNNYPRY